jgi:hypothetical protein
MCFQNQVPIAYKLLHNVYKFQCLKTLSFIKTGDELQK